MEGEEIHAFHAFPMRSDAFPMRFDAFPMRSTRGAARFLQRRAFQTRRSNGARRKLLFSSRNTVVSGVVETGIC